MGFENWELLTASVNISVFFLWLTVVNQNSCQFLSVPLLCLTTSGMITYTSTIQLHNYMTSIHLRKLSIIFVYKGKLHYLLSFLWTTNIRLKYNDIIRSCLVIISVVLITFSLSSSLSFCWLHAAFSPSLPLYSSLSLLCNVCLTAQTLL